MSLKDAVAGLRQLRAELSAVRKAKADLEAEHAIVVEVSLDSNRGTLVVPQHDVKGTLGSTIAQLQPS